MNLDIVIVGLSITSSWGNGHATTYRALVKALADRGHSVTFLERDVPWYRDNRDMPTSEYCSIGLYKSLADFGARYTELLREADLVIMGSYVPDGIALGDWITAEAKGITAFYDIDTPVTLAALEAGGVDYISAHLIPRFDLYLSFSGGTALDIIEQVYNSPMARVLYCSADPGAHPEFTAPAKWSLGYLGTYSADRQPLLEDLLLDPAARLVDQSFVIAGSKYPAEIAWPDSLQHIPHLPPSEHRHFYQAQRFTLNVTRADMKALGFSPSVRLFEAAACGAPIISDAWPGLETIFKPGEELLVASHSDDVVDILTTMPNDRRLSLANRARERLLREHTPAHRAVQLEAYYREAAGRRVPVARRIRRSIALEEAK
ncbi:glycosyltransferase [Tardiphaga sp.]|jgi:spore maturation protein CgeB|uniref:CgeB family protein n=1 Tax=Tardiphaga sp. TaxID=1926292 RepID=UPI0037DA16B4